jgi:glycosyltransferase involved in cell wall biosynthesis
MKQKISVIMPVYNGSKFLGTSIPSVLAQSLDDFEFIIVDDCSKDNSRNLLKEWAARDARIRLYFNEVNKGIFGTLNYLIDLTKNDLIKIFCQDDVMMPNCLERQVAFMEERPFLAYSRCMGTQEADGVSRMGAVDAFAHLPEIIYPAASALAYFTFGNIPGNLTNVIIRKTALLNAGGFSQKSPYAGDFEAWVRLAQSYAFGIQREALVYVHTHPQQGSVTLNKQSELIHQLDEIVGGLFVRLPEELRGKAKWYGSLSYLIPHVSTTVRRVLEGKWKAVCLLFVARNYAYPAAVGLVLYVVTLGGRFGRRCFLNHFVAGIHRLNS